MLSKQLQKQIEQEGNDRAEGWQDKMKSQIAKTEYELGAEKYGQLYETALARAERAEKALKEIQEKGIDLILPYLPDGSVGSQTIIEMDRLITNILTPKTGEDE